MNANEYYVEKATAEMLPQVADEMYMDPSYLKRVRAMMEKDECVLFVAKLGDVYVGRCTLWLAPADEPELRQELPDAPIVNALEVHPEHYRKGIASLLMTALEKECIRRDKSVLVLGVEPQNTPGRKLYEKLGFVYRTTLGKETYPCFWYETASDGSMKKHTIEARLMVKELV